MNLNQMVVTAALALGSVGAIAAGGPLDLSTGSTGFASTPVAGGFSDMFTFTLTTPSVATASITSAVSGAQDVDLSFIALTGPSGVFSFTQALADPFETWVLASTSLLAAGNYVLTVVGMNSAAIGSYGGNIGVTPVPEPETYALLLAGLGAIGFLVSRRSV